jgi:cyanuric acid amidohydrolase
MTRSGATRRAFLHRLSTRGPDDVASLEAMIAAGRIDPNAIVAIFGKTEGNGCVNDFTRGFASRALKDALKRHLPADRAEAVCIVMSGGTEGALAPHILVMEAREVDAPAQPGALALGRARTPHLPTEALGRLGQVDLVAAGVREAMGVAGIANAGDVHFVQIKCPLLTAGRLADIEARGLSGATRDTLKSMGLSRAASALGVGVALGEIDRASLTEGAIGRDWSLYSNRASASAGVELTDHEIVVIGAAPGWSGPLRAAHCVMRDAIDIEPVRAALEELGMTTPGQLAQSDRGRLVALLAKAEAGSSGLLRGHRHTMLDDSDISPTRHARAFVAGALAGLVGHAEIYVSGGAEHQGPDGGGPVAVIASRAGESQGV